MTRTISKTLILLYFMSIPLAHAENTAVSHAEESPKTPAEETMPVIKNLTDSLDFLNIIKERELPLDPIALQTVLNRILDLWNAQNESMLSDLHAAQNILPADYKERVTSYRNELSAIRLRNEDAREKINQNISVREAIALAEELRTSHEVIEPALNEIVDFTSVSTNQNAIIKTANRLTAIMKDEKRIRIILSGKRWKSFTELMKQTQMLIKNADQFNKKAGELLAQQDKTDEGSTIESLITQSENNIKAAYTNFLAMSKLIKK